VGVKKLAPQRKKCAARQTDSPATLDRFGIALEVHPTTRPVRIGNRLATETTKRVEPVYVDDLDIRWSRLGA